MRDLSEHSVQPTSFGEGKQTTNPVDWDDVLCTVVHDAYSLVGVWDIICRKLSELSQIRIRYGAEELSGEVLPEDYESASCHFEFLLARIGQSSLMTLRGLLTSTSLRNHFEILLESDRKV